MRLANGNTVQITDYYKTVFQELYPLIKLYIQEPNKRYIFTGHSLGGALASLLAMETASDAQV